MTGPTRTAQRWDVSGVPTIGALLRSRAAEFPDRPLLRFRDREVTYSELDDRSDRLAAGLARRQVVAGATVAVLCGNRTESVESWFALCRIGAVAGMVNTSLKGQTLAHALNSMRAEIAIIEAPYVAAVIDVAPDLGFLRTLIVIDGGETPHTPGFSFIEFASIPEPESESVPEPESESVRPGGPASAPTMQPASATSDPSAPAMVLFTSGSTGPSKGCVLSHRYAVRQAQLMVENLRLTERDVLYCPFPLYHLDASVLTVLPALVLGATAALAPRFSVSGFWDDIRAMGATVFDFMGATLTMLHKQPARPDDADNPARLGWGVPMPETAGDFEKRFGLRLVELYGSTDAGIPIYQPLDEPRRAGSCGRAIPQYDVRLFDDAEREVPPGAVGEIVLRPYEPSLISDGYLHRPDATVESRRNLWFHTGDLARRDDDGWFYFHGRLTDAIRRRGENISAFEIEEAIKLHPSVLDVAAFGVPSEYTEDDVMVAVVARPGYRLDPDTLISHCVARLAAFAVPRYIDLVETLPRTPTEKVEKRGLADRGVTATTWDREANR